MNKEHIYKVLQQSFSAKELDKWYPSLDLAIQGDVLHVCFPHRYFEDWFALHIRQHFEQSLADSISRINYTCWNGSIKQPVQETHLAHPSLPFGAEYLFDNFLVNEKNFFPATSARQVAQHREITYNPLVVCGPSGSGKSFILRAIANVKSEQFPGGVHLVGLEDMRQLYLLRSDARNYLLSKHFLAMDDLQTIASYPDLQEELVILFDYYHSHNKQMVFGCANKAGKLDFLTPKLKARLEWGLVVYLKAPDLDIRSQFILKKCQERGLELSRERVIYLAQCCKDLRKLEGCLHRMFAYQDLVQHQISDAEFASIFSSLAPHTAAALDTDHILNVVCSHFAVSREEVLSGSRKQELVFARQVAMYLCRKLLGLSFPELGRAFGGKDHSTALYSYRKVEQLRNDDKNVKIMLQTLSNTCLGSNEIGNS